MLIHTIAAFETEMDAVFRTELAHEFRDPSAVGLCDECAVLVSLAVLGYKLRELFFQEGKKDAGGAGL